MTSADTALLDLQAPATAVARLAADLTDLDLEGPTPCQFPVRQLLAHLLGLSVAFADAAAKVDGPTTRTPPSPDALELPADWREQLPVRLDALVARP